MLELEETLEFLGDFSHITDEETEVHHKQIRRRAS